MIDFKEYSEAVENTRSHLNNKNMDTVHMLFGIITELGELSDVFKKYLAYGKDIDWINVKEELGDLMWYVVGFCNINDINLEDVIKANIEKLKARYPNGFNYENATKRDLDAERKILTGVSKVVAIDESPDKFPFIIKVPPSGRVDGDYEY